MFKKAGLILCVSTLCNLATILLYSCHCKTDKRKYCIELRSVSITLQDNAGLDPQPVLNQTVYAKALILTIALNEVRYECRKPTSSPFFNAAYAICKEPNENWYRLSNMRIFLDRNYDSAHPAGADISDLCVKKGYDYYLMSAPDDTSGTYTFTVQLACEHPLKPVKDTLQATTVPLKLIK